MAKYWHVCLTFLTRRLLQVWLAIMSLVVWAFAMTALNRGPDEREMMQPFLMVLMAPVGFMIGAHLKQLIARPEASLVPNYRVPHLIVAVLWLLAPVLVLEAVSFACFSGGSLGGFAVSLFVMTVTVNLGASPGVLGMTGIVSAILIGLVPELRVIALSIIRGTEHLGTSVLLLVEVCWLGWLARHLLRLEESDRDYSQIASFSFEDYRAAATRLRERSISRRLEWFSQCLHASATRQLAKLTQRPVSTRMDRIRLSALGENSPNSTWFELLLMAVIEIGLLVYSHSKLVDERAFRSALGFPILFAGVFTWGQWLPLLHRWPRLGYESLRPATRQDWAANHVLGQVYRATKYLLWWMTLQALLLVVLVPQLPLRAETSLLAIAEALVWTLGAQIWIFGLCWWLTSFGHHLLSLIGMSFVFIAAALPWVSLSHREFRGAPEATLEWFILGALILAGCGAGSLAYRRWCRMDLP